MNDLDSDQQLRAAIATELIRCRGGYYIDLVEEMLAISEAVLTGTAPAQQPEA